MVLTEEQAKLFYDLWIPLLDFVNQKYKLCKDFYGMDSPKGLLLDVRKALFVDLRTAYLIWEWNKSGTNIEMPVMRRLQENGVKNMGLRLKNKIALEEAICY